MGHQFINFNFQKKELYQYKQTFRHCFFTNTTELLSIINHQFSYKCDYRNIMCFLYPYSTLFYSELQPQKASQLVS